jgi:hypothetical protein
VSEYQYYEFVALDRPLTPAELRSISTPVANLKCIKLATSSAALWA